MMTVTLMIMLIMMKHEDADDGNDVADDDNTLLLIMMMTDNDDDNNDMLEIARLKQVKCFQMLMAPIVTYLQGGCSAGLPLPKTEPLLKL